MDPTDLTRQSDTTIKNVVHFVPNRTGPVQLDRIFGWSLSLAELDFRSASKFLGKLWKIFKQRHTPQLEAERNHNKGSSQKFKAL